MMGLTDPRLYKAYHCFLLLSRAIDRFHSRDQILDYRCYAAILVYQNCKQTSSGACEEHDFVSDCWLWQEKWTREKDILCKGAFYRYKSRLKSPRIVRREKIALDFSDKS